MSEQSNPLDDYKGAVIVARCSHAQLTDTRRLFTSRLKYHHSECEIADGYALWHMTSIEDAMDIYQHLSGAIARISVQNWLPDEWLQSVIH